MNFKKIVAALVVVFAIFCVVSLGKIGEDVKNETIVVNQYPFTGNMEYWTSPGFTGSGGAKPLLTIKLNSCGSDLTLRLAISRENLFL